MTLINKQKFLAELGRLLTFMYEEDRLHALALYDEIFEETGNETAVLQMLVSPTRQAVNLARAYDAKERRYQADEGERPAYEQVIEELRIQAGTLMPAVPRYDPAPYSVYRGQETDDAGENLFESLGFHDLPEPESASGSPASDAPEIASFPDEDKGDAPVPAAPRPADAEETPAPGVSAYPVDDFSDAVDDFLKDFYITDGPLMDSETPPAAEPVKAAPAGEFAWEPLPPAGDKIQDVKDVWALIPDEEPSPAPAVQAPRAPAAPQAAPAAPAAPAAVQEVPPYRESRSAAAVRGEQPVLSDRTERKASVGLLILFILLAVPVGIVCTALLLSAAALVLGLSAGTLCVGVSGLISAFSFSVFSDLLLVFGLSLACAAIGLLLLWIFIWLLFGAIPGLVRGLCALARRLCYKEVAV